MALGVIIIIMGLILGGFGLRNYWLEENAGKEYEELKEQAVIDVPPAATEDQEVVIPIDFESLTAEYPDVYAWIRIPGTTIDYPIVQREGDNAYYLNHTAEGKKSIAGAIYTEDYNGKDFSDPNTVIYGHNMKNGSMFKQLHKYKDRQFFSEHSEIMIYQPNRVLNYRIFAAYVYDNQHLMKSFDFANTQVYASYLNEISQRKGMNGNLDTTVEVTQESNIITLSTCTANDSQRYLVQAVLLSIDEK